MSEQHDQSVQEVVKRLHDAHDKMVDQIGRIIVGQRDVVDQLMMSLFCQGHAVLVGVPGLAKTLLVSTISKALSLDFSRYNPVEGIKMVVLLNWKPK